MAGAISTQAGSNVTIKPYADIQEETVVLYGNKTITNRSTLTIVCNGEKKLTIDGRSDLSGTTAGGNSRLLMNNAGAVIHIGAGVTIQYANRNDAGGGLYNNGGTANLSCDFKYNEAYRGGAVYNEKNSVLVIHGGVYQNNKAHAYTDNRSDGGAIFNKSVSKDNSITGATFISNEAIRNGGAIANDVDCYLEIRNCGFKNNTCVSSGGAIVMFGGTVSIEDTWFVGNTRGSYEGVPGIMKAGGTIPKFVNITTVEPQEK